MIIGYSHRLMSLGKMNLQDVWYTARHWNTSILTPLDPWLNYRIYICQKINVPVWGLTTYKLSDVKGSIHCSSSAYLCVYITYWTGPIAESSIFFFLIKLLKISIIFKHYFSKIYNIQKWCSRYTVVFCYKSNHWLIFTHSIVNPHRLSFWCLQEYS